MDTSLIQGQPWKISGKAFDLLECFMSGIDDVIVRIAFQYAKERQDTNTLGEIRIEAKDIQKAAFVVLEQLRLQDLPENVKSDLNGMGACLREKCEKIL